MPTTNSHLRTHTHNAHTSITKKEEESLGSNIIALFHTQSFPSEPAPHTHTECAITHGLYSLAHRTLCFAPRHHKPTKLWARNSRHRLLWLILDDAKRPQHIFERYSTKKERRESAARFARVAFAI